MKIAIASGKGGTGKTFVSTNLFQTAIKTGFDVILVDCDAEEPNLCEFIRGDLLSSLSVYQNIPVIDTDKCTFCGKCHEWCTYNAIFFLPQLKQIKVIEDLCHDCGACIVACREGAITEKQKNIGTISTFLLEDQPRLIEGRTVVGTTSSIPVIKKAIKQADGKPFVLFDAPPGISCPFIATVEPADYIILVTEPTPFGLNDLMLSVEILEQLGKPFGVIINRTGLGNNAVHEWLTKKGIRLLTEIPFDKEIAISYSDGRLIVDESPKYFELFRSLLKIIQKEANHTIQ